MADCLGLAFTGRDQQRRLGEAITGGQRSAVETCRFEPLGEPRERGSADKLRARECKPPAAQIEPREGFVGNTVRTQRVGEIRPAAERSAVPIDRLQPAPRPLQKIARRHQNRGEAGEQRVQQSADQSHVVVQRQPTDEDVIRRSADGRLDGEFIGGQIAVGDANALRLRR